MRISDWSSDVCSSDLQWDLERPMVVAHDMGGAATLRAHLLHGCDFDRYVLMNVVALRPWGSAFFDHVGRHVAAFLGLPPHIHKAVVEAHIKGALVNDIAAADFQKLASSDKRRVGKECVRTSRSRCCPCH